MWNSSSSIPAAALAFEHVGAVNTAGLLRSLYANLPLGDAADQDPSASFLSFRAAVDGPWFEVDDPIDEVEKAILSHAIAHPSEFVGP